tara:strand:+ start:638 stop:853 length:216 start_codon:yes stop_codon:yes gene_type:complete
MKPDHVKRFEESLSYPDYTSEQKKLGLNNKDMDWLCEHPMFYMVFIPSLVAMLPATIMACVVWYHQYYIGI